MDNRTMHTLDLDEEKRRQVEAFANRAVAEVTPAARFEKTAAASRPLTPPTSKKGRTRRGWSKWWRKQLAAYEASR